MLGLLRVLMDVFHPVFDMGVRRRRRNPSNLWFNTFLLSQILEEKICISVRYRQKKEGRLFFMIYESRVKILKSFSPDCWRWTRFWFIGLGLLPSEDPLCLSSQGESRNFPMGFLARFLFFRQHVKSTFNLINSIHNTNFQIKPFSFSMEFQIMYITSIIVEDVS